MNDWNSINEKIRNAADMIEIVGRYVRLKQVGTRHRGLCPFHKEKTPSFYVNEDLKLYKCFGCGEGGNIFSFVMKMENMDFNEAFKWLAQQCGISINYLFSSEGKKETSLKSQSLEALEQACQFYERNLLHQTDHISWLEYLEKRGISRLSIRHWRLGAASKHRNKLVKHIEKQNLPIEAYVSAGLIKLQKESHYVDVFSNRLMFPICDISGRVVGFSGRTMSSNVGAKYINTADTILFKKSKLLYGLHIAKGYMRKSRNVILVEGFTDAIMLHQYDINNVIASLGTAITPSQINIVKNYIDSITLILDGDAAGQKATLNTISTILKADIDVYILPLPTNYDPDSYIRSENNTFKEDLRDKKKHYINYYIEYGQKEGRWKDLTERNKLIEEVFALIALSKYQLLKKHILLQQLSQCTNIDVTSLTEIFNQYLRRRKKSVKKITTPKPEDNIHYIPLPNHEKGLLRLMIKKGESMIKLIGNYCPEEYFSHAQSRFLYNHIIKSYLEGLDINKEMYLNFDDPQMQKIISEIFIEKNEPSKSISKITGRYISIDDDYEVANETMKKLHIMYHQKQLEEMKLSVGDDTVNQRHELKKKLMNIKNQSAKVSFPPV